MTADLFVWWAEYIFIGATAFLVAFLVAFIVSALR
jgi:hypothetical protein